ncbi:tRNA (adenosine(37)-N6)-threonylcarbamoyltransferase complex transferase subunit TsaD [Candidatus Pacearchaeota archaeon]|nr:tRNA (adenosine(37)-N6)-threonylcarbamoyltransferase complex transferase subunit TsaD [Candidatus Pacearchaeota archaeon]
MPTVLGIESTAHTFGIGIVKNGKVLANIKRSFTTASGEEGGMIPIEVAKFHCENKNEIYFEALTEAGLDGKESQIDAIAFSQGPGLAPCLIEGMKFAKELSERLKKPVVGVNHCIAHLEVGRIKNLWAIEPVMLYVSGANTQVIAYESGKYRVFGETLDMGVGNFIDVFGRALGVGFPAGVKIEELAKKSKPKNYIELPYTVKGMDIALSGILTNLQKKIKSEGVSKEDLAYSMQETVFSMLVEITERALAHTGKKEVLLGGGVTCNKRLQEMCEIMCSERENLGGGRVKFFVPENSLLVDNGAMIAYLGEIMFKKKSNTFSYKKLNKVDIKPKQRTDDVGVNWRD